MGIREDAVAYVKANKRSIVEQFASKEQFPPVLNPETFFMAGSPGAGKTEWSTNFLRFYESEYSKDRFVRIDPDAVRSQIPGYTGSNSDEVQGAASLAAQKIFDAAISRGQNILLDGTFASYELSQQNIKRSISHKRVPVIVIYVYQDPLIAWDVTKARTLREGRTVPKSFFIDSYFAARENVNRAKSEFGSNMVLYLLVRNADQPTFTFKANIEKIDHHLKNVYTRSLLEEKLV
jgi:UDP-N-acetylglucosamine kinase